MQFCAEATKQSRTSKNDWIASLTLAMTAGCLTYESRIRRPSHPVASGVAPIRIDIDRRRPDLAIEAARGALAGITGHHRPRDGPDVFASPSVVDPNMPRGMAFELMMRSNVPAARKRDEQTEGLDLVDRDTHLPV